MKTFNKITALLFVLGLLLGITACTEKVTYDPAEVPGSVQVYFPSSLSSTVALSQDRTVTSYEIPLYRIDKTNALTVSLIVQNDNPDIFNIPASASFAAGSESTKITIIYDPSKLDYDAYKPITITISDESVTSPYGNSVYAFKAGIPAPWISLGMATFSENQFIFDSWETELQQDETNLTHYRLVDAFAGRSQYYSNVTVNDKADTYFEFYVLPAGSTYTSFNREDGKITFTTTVNGLVVFEPTNIGMTYVGNGDLTIMHPAARTPTSAGEEFWLHNIVTQWSADGKPEIVQIAPWYVFPPSWAGYNYTQNDGIITIVFPGASLVHYDYSMSLNYLGHYIDLDDVDNAIVQFTKGADVASYKYAIVNGALNATSAEDVAAGITDGTIAAEESTDSGYKIFPLTEAGKYSVVAVSFDQDGKSQESGYVTFDFTPAGTENPWVSLGFCKYTDDVFVPLYSNDPSDIPTYDVEILQNKDTPGLFRLKNAYGAGYPYNEPGDYDPGNVYIEINATDPDGVYIDYQSMGVNWGDGTAYIYSYASYYMDNGKSFEDVKAAGYCGTFKDGVITFPTKMLLVNFEGSSSLYYGNTNGLWKVDMTSLHASPAKKASLRSSLSRSFSPKGASIKMNSIQPVRVKGKNVPASVIRKNIIDFSPLVR